MKNKNKIVPRARRERIREQIAQAQDYRCAICGEFMGQRDRTFDHIIPRAAGGSNRIENLRLAHRRCNQERGDRLSEADATLHAELQAVRASLSGVAP